MTQPEPHKQPDAPPARRNRADAVARELPAAGATAFQRAGFRDPSLVLRWDEIVGPEIARIARPLRLGEGSAGGILTLKAEPAASLFLQHESRSLIEKINAYLGRNAVAKLRFVQGPLAAAPVRRSLRLRTAEVPTGDPALAYRGPAGLREALLALASMRRRAPAD